MGNRFARFNHSLNGRLLLTHMLVAAAVLIIAAVLLLSLQAPARNDLALRRMVEWLDTAVTTTRGSLVQAVLANNQDGAAADFLGLLRTQAENLNGRILLVDEASRAILFDSADVLVGETWQPASASPLDVQMERWRPNHMRSMPRMQGMADAQTARGQVKLDGRDWMYIAAPMFAMRDGGSVDLVLLRQENNPIQAVAESVQELPRGLLLAMVLVLGLVVYFLSRWTAGAVARSLAPVLQGTEAIADGDLSYRIDSQATSLNELRVLAESFNQMAARVQRSQQAQRDFVANVSHDLKTPLTSIQGYSQALLDGTAASDASRSRAALVINQEAQRLGRLVEEVIDLARIDSGRLQLRLEPVDLAALLAELVELLAPRTAAAGIALSTHLPTAGLPPLRGDPDRLRRVLTNLLDNALAYTPSGGAVTVTAAPYPAGAGQPAGVEIAVTDTGPGIAPEDVERIFERFYRVDKARTAGNGSGLGLAIVKEIVEAHGGAVGVESQPGQGSRFWLRLPV